MLGPARPGRCKANRRPEKDIEFVDTLVFSRLIDPMTVRELLGEIEDVRSSRAVQHLDRIAARGLRSHNDTVGTPNEVKQSLTVELERPNSRPPTHSSSRPSGIADSDWVLRLTRSRTPK